MMQLQISQFIGCDGLLNTTKLIDAIDTWKIGSIFETPGNQGGLYAWYTPPKLAELIDQIQYIALNHGSKIPILYGIDNIHGANYIKGTTIFPQGIGMAATFNLKLIQDAGRIGANTVVEYFHGILQQFYLHLE